jgi:hypothetical protein
MDEEGGDLTFARGPRFWLLCYTQKNSFWNSSAADGLIHSWQAKFIRIKRYTSAGDNFKKLRFLAYDLNFTSNSLIVFLKWKREYFPHIAYFGRDLQNSEFVCGIVVMAILTYCFLFNSAKYSNFQYRFFNVDKV